MTNIIEHTLARYPNFPRAVIDRLLEKAAEDMAKTLDAVLEKAAEDILAGYQKAEPEPSVNSGAKGDVHSPQWRGRVTRSLNNARPAFNALHQFTKAVPPSPSEGLLYDLISKALNPGAPVDVAKAAIDDAKVLYSKVGASIALPLVATASAPIMQAQKQLNPTTVRDG